MWERDHLPELFHRTCAAGVTVAQRHRALRGCVKGQSGLAAPTGSCQRDEPALVHCVAHRFECVAELSEADELRVRFETPQSAITPGQAVVLYDGDVVLGGGWITSAV